MGIGQVIAGMLEDWRLPFLIVSIPGILCSFAILLFNDPPRGANEAAVLETLNGGNNHVVAQESALSQSDAQTVSVAHGDHVQAVQNCGMNCDASKVRIDSVPMACNVQAPNTSHLETIEYDNDTRITTVSEAAASNDLDHLVSDGKASETSCQSTIALLKTPSVLLIILQAAPGSL